MILMLHILSDLRLLLLPGSAEDTTMPFLAALTATLLAVFAASSVVNVGAGCSSRTAAAQRAARGHHLAHG